MNYLMTVSEVDKGKSQTEASMYWPSDGRADVWDFLAFERTFEVIKLFITWRQTEKNERFIQSEVVNSHPAMRAFTYSLIHRLKPSTTTQSVN